MSLPVVTNINVPFPAGVAAATLTGALYGVLFDSAQATPSAVLTISVAANQGVPSDYVPLIVDGAQTGSYITALQIPVGRGGFFPLPIEMQNLPVKIQLQIQNAGIAVNVQLVTSA
jgi:hypothetical protein